MPRFTLWWWPLVLGLAGLAWWLWPRTASLEELRGLTRRARWREARAGLVRFVGKHPDSAPAWLLLGRAHRELGESAEAAGCFEHAAASPLHRAEALYRQGDVYWSMRRAGRAERCWRQVIDQTQAAGDRTWQAWSLGRLGDLYVLLDDAPQAREVLWRLYQGFPAADAARVDLLLRLTVFDIQTYHIQTAVSHLEQFVAADPDDVLVATALALAYLRVGQPDAAQTLMDQLSSRHGDSPLVWAARLKYLAATGDRAALRATVRKVPAGTREDDALVWRHRAIDHDNYDELAEAIACYERALALDRRDYAVRARLAQGLRRAGRDAEYQSQMKQVDQTAQLLAELSHLTSKLPPEPGQRVTIEQCIELARLCTALGWERESAGWRQLVALRTPKSPDGEGTNP